MEATQAKQYETDVLVIGGGLPGVCAAIQAARLGCTVTLVERAMTLGGNCGPEIGVCASDAHDHHPFMAATGIVGELFATAGYLGCKTQSNWHLYNINTMWETVMAQALRGAGVRLLRRHLAHTPVMSGSRIAAVLCEDLATLRTVRIDVRVCVIDDSGDGDVSARAGAAFRMGREAQSEYGERCAPERADKVTLGSSLVALLRKTDHPVPFTPPPGTPPFHPSYREMTPFAPRPEDECAFFYPCETGGDIDTIEDDNEIYERLILQLYAAWDRVKNVTHVEAARNWEMVWISARVAKRESRRFVGDYTLTQTDIEQGAMHEDALAVGGYPLDVHNPRPENNEYIRIEWYSLPPVYGIPYRCMYSANIDNLFFASRLLSVSHLAHSSVRMQRTLAAVGMAVGCAAALVKKHGCSPRDLLARLDELKQCMFLEDGTVPGFVKSHPEDLALRASVTASSETRYGIAAEPGEWVPLDRHRGLDLWDFTLQLETLRLNVRNAAAHPVTLRGQARRFAPPYYCMMRGDRPAPAVQGIGAHYHIGSKWGHAQRADWFQTLQSVQVEVPARFEGELSLPFRLTLAPKAQHSDDDRLLILLSPCEGLELLKIDTPYSFVRRIDDLADGLYAVCDGAYAYALSPAPPHGTAAQAISGSNRRWATHPLNMWRPIALPAWITLSWPQPIPLREVRITFDTLAERAKQMPYEAPGKRAADQCVKDYRLVLLRAGEPVLEQTVEGNYRRLRRHAMDGATGDALRIEIQGVWQDGALPGIYDIAVF